MNALATEKTMSVKELAEVLGVSERVVQLSVKKLYPEIVKNGKATNLNEEQVTLIKKELSNHHNLEGTFEVKTSLEKRLIIAQAMRILDDEIQDLREQLNEAKPKIEFYDQVTGSRSAIPMSIAAKVLNMGFGRNQLFEFLRKVNVLRHNNEPYQEYVDRGWFRVVEQKVVKPDGEILISIKTLVYQKGLDGIKRLINQFNDYRVAI